MGGGCETGDWGSKHHQSENENESYSVQSIKRHGRTIRISRIVVMADMTGISFATAMLVPVLHREGA